MKKRRNRSDSSAWMALPLYIFTIVFVVCPLIYMVALSFATPSRGFGVTWKFTLDNYRNILEPVYLNTFVESLKLAFTSTIVIALIGYWIFNVPSPFLIGFLTCFATIIPVVGTALVWFPLALYMALTGDWVNALGLTAYALIVVTNVDNLIRFVLQKKMADTHPLITIFGVIIGLSLFGFMGIIFGPLLISIFILCFNIFKEKYLENAG